MRICEMFAYFVLDFYCNGFYALFIDDLFISNPCYASCTMVFNHFKNHLFYFMFTLFFMKGRCDIWRNNT